MFQGVRKDVKLSGNRSDPLLNLVLTETLGRRPGFPANSDVSDSYVLFEDTRVCFSSSLAQ